ncbi:LysR substrate-binding domain-containing protein [Sphingobacterium thalpophilum]|uniref:CysJI operon transcriptional activator n=1 Tax=Sphingobacterium thalpophilum TaxID=259 RepID=A0A4U9UN78_9SPHI|nr:LysR family transcriptional regulator [Sphingobacterium thalpophilum]VTR30961.1 CysJI operon transcriptional activator [Sphingobacterium thalpophilum]
MDFDFRLLVFYTAAQHLNFTKTASALFISQPAVSKNIQELEKKLGIPLFERKGNNLNLTESGQILYKYAQQIINLYNQAGQEIQELQHGRKGNLVLGASTTISQYILPALLADFLTQYPNNRIQSFQSNSRSIEEQLMDKTLDLGITEGSTDNRSLKYIPFMKDELVLVTNSGNPLLKQLKDPMLADITRLPLVLREQGSGTRTIIENALKDKHINLSEIHIEMILPSTESIKAYLLRRNSFAFLSIHTVQKEVLNNQLCIVDIPELTIDRYFYFTHLYGGLAGTPNQFLQFCLRQNFKV